MKLASLRNGSPDGELIIVNRTLTRAVTARAIAPTLQAALDDWETIEPQLTDRAEALAAGDVDDAFDFDSTDVLSPLPRAYHWVDGSAYVNHVELVRKARGAEMPEQFWHDPLVYQGGSDDFLPPVSDAAFPSEEFGIDIEAETAIVTGRVPIGTKAAAADGYVRLLMLVNDWSLRNLIPGELAKGFGFYQSKPATTFSPVAVTPDELGNDWREGMFHLPLRTHLNGELFGEPDCGTDMTFGFHQLIEHVARTRNLGAGTIIGSGTVSNYDRSKGSSCLAERRTLETIEHGSPVTRFMSYGDTVRIEMLDGNGNDIFGAIEQTVVPA